MVINGKLYLFPFDINGDNIFSATSVICLIVFC